MFGGDWPVSTQAVEYPRWVQVLDDALRGSPESDLKKLYVTNAEEFYRV
jgi:L-fuconolactonase